MIHVDDRHCDTVIFIFIFLFLFAFYFFDSFWTYSVLNGFWFGRGELVDTKTQSPGSVDSFPLRSTFEQLGHGTGTGTGSMEPGSSSSLGARRYPARSVWEPCRADNFLLTVNALNGKRGELRKYLRSST